MGTGMHAKARFVLDRFRMHKYIISATSHLKDSAQDEFKTTGMEQNRCG